MTFASPDSPSCDLLLTPAGPWQVFMWLQEKSLFGEAALVFNPAPGLFFTAVDMIR